MTQVNAAHGTNSVFGTFSAAGSPQLALAMLQMELAKTNKDKSSVHSKQSIPGGSAAGTSFRRLI